MNRFVAGLGFVVAGVAMTLAARLQLPKRARRELKKRAHIEDFTPHAHEGMTHDHLHAHVTHNRREGMDGVMGEWEHLTSTHSHGHNHPALTHSHAAHEDAAHEHLGEAHIHDHEHPMRS